MRNLYSWNNMLSGYAKLGKTKPARKLFDKMPEKDVVSWNTMVIAYAQSGFCNEALRFYREFRNLGIGYNEYSFAGLLNVCVKFKELELTRQAHGQVLVAGFLSNLVISSSVVHAYAKCREMSDARLLFDEMNVRDILAWTTLVSGYAQLGDMEAANELFDLMPKKNPVSWTALIAGIASLNHGKQIHGYLIRTNFSPNTIVVSSLIDMYSKCGSMGIARLVFDVISNKRDVVLWNTMISALAQHGHGEEAIQLFDDMVRLRMKPDGITMVVILNACSHSGLVQEGLGRAGHFDMLMNQLEKCHAVKENSHENMVGSGIINGGKFFAELALCDVKKFLSSTQSEIIILEIWTEFGHQDTPDFDEVLGGTTGRVSDPLG
ncbi:hypothetical protein GH714_031406 [Hevea brasiliensis]|uniref:Pentatricopeptide repeat-containing protein n=1 Tax=Hevea brasiliensis TaxID=3981 RepID=A0A6A6LKP8_HEVBR|nr:hypothetical protein GH714_031406 [Hevea brasiliensis]